MLALYTLLIIVAVTYAFWQEGLLTNVCCCVNVMLSGVLAFNFYEPIADELDSMFQNNFLAGSEDFLSLVGIFSLSLGLLRLTAGTLAPSDPEYHPILYRAGGVVLGILTGYLAGGFLACAITTLPLPRGFLGYPEKPETNLPLASKLLPGDRVWLAMMRRAGLTNLNDEEDKTFDPKANFILRHSRHRRVDENTGKAFPDDGTFLPAETGKLP